MLQRLREWLTIVFVFLLPFHALLVTVLTKLIAGPDRAPLRVLALWKEGVVGVILVIALAEIVMQWRSGKRQAASDKPDALDMIILASILLGITVSLAHRSPLTAHRFLYGFKYDFLPLIAFLILRRVSWSETFVRRFLAALLTVGSIVALYGLVTWRLQLGFFRSLGYSDLHSLYVPGGPLAPFQQIEGAEVRRLQSTMSGPNQLGLWLLIPLSIVLVQLIRGEAGSGKRGAGRVALLALLLASLLLTFSRTAWVGAVMMVAVLAWLYRDSAIVRRLFLAGCGLVALAGLLVALWRPALFSRAMSTAGHLEKPRAAVVTMLAHPFGLGLGSAGPASNAVSDTCVELAAGADASWARQRSNLCVFVGGAQVQPADRSCHCPLLTENWYLQVGVEMGFLGLILYVALIVLMLRRLGMENGKWKIVNEEQLSTFSIFNFQFSIFLIFLALSIAALLLHAFEDAAVAYTVWVMAGVVLAVVPSSPRR